MAHIQTEPQAGVIHTPDDVREPLGLRFQNVLQNDLHAGVLPQKFLPERDGLLHIPDGIVDPGIITAVEDDLFRAVDLGKIDAILPESEQVKGEVFQRTERIKLYILEVKDNPKGPRISVSRTHPDLVRRLFEAEIAEAGIETDAVSPKLLPNYTKQKNI
jgi:hypothetical protein